jgi:hypothetical protein
MFESTIPTVQQEQAEYLSVFSTAHYIAKEVGNDCCSSLRKEGAQARSLEKSCPQQMRAIFTVHSVA